jgi:hypothetical protein
VYYINFGPHGPRAERVRDGWQILGGLATCGAVSFTLFWILRQYSILFFNSGSHIVAPPPPRTMTKEWQEATNKRLRDLGIEPISGPGNPDYKASQSSIVLIDRDEESFMGTMSTRRIVKYHTNPTKKSRLFTSSSSTIGNYQLCKYG